MRFTRTLTIATIVALGAAGCGKTSGTADVTADAPTTTTVADTSSTVPTTPAVQVNVESTTTTTAAPSADLAAKLADTKLRGKVKAEVQKWVDKYDYIVAAFSTTGTDVTDENVDESITDACTGVDPAEGAAALVLFAGESMKAHGDDMVEVMTDIKALNAKVADLADC